MKKRLLSLLLVFAMVLGLCTTTFAAGTDNFKQVNTYKNGQFKDVTQERWFAPTVQRAYELGLMKGTGDGTIFNPNGNVTIAETLALACRLHSTYYGNGVQFVQGKPWYQVYVDYAVANGMIAADDYDDYNAMATRAEFVTILAACMPAEAFPVINEIENGEIPDVNYYNEEVYLMYRAGVLTGSDNYGTFKPESNIMRSEVATIVVRMADPSQRKSVTLTPPPESTVENNQGVWRSADGEVEVVFNGKYFTYARQYEWDGGVTSYLYQGVIGEYFNQYIVLEKYEYEGINDGLDNKIMPVSLFFENYGNCASVTCPDSYGAFVASDYVYKVTSADLTKEVRALIGEENILSTEYLKASAVTSIRMAGTYEVLDASDGEDYYWPDTTDCYATINGKEYEMLPSMLYWTSSNTSVARPDSHGRIGVRANGTVTITAEFNGMQASATLSIINCVPVEYISDRYVWDYDGYYAFVYALKDADYNRIARDCYVILRIVNDNGETVYESEQYVWDWEFKQWTYQGEKMLLGTIYINDDEITPGTIDTGKLYYQVSDTWYGDFFWFSEYSRNIYDLPLKETTLELPTLPQDINCYSYDNVTVRHSCTVTAASYKVDGDHMTVYLSGQKTYDENGSWQSGSCSIGWKLYDAEGYVVDSGTCYTSSVSEGEKFRNAEINIYDLEIGGSYRLVLLHCN